jgi:hypothetical protein
LITALASAALGSCSWENPGANPYRGDPVDVLVDFGLPDKTRQRLADLMRAHRFSDLVTITRDSIEGQQSYDNLRQMHSGHGVVCRGTVDRSRWPAAHVERGLVYCADGACVLVPTVCNNVSLVSRIEPARPEEAAPIDISPNAGPTPPSTESADADSGALLADAWAVPPLPVPPDDFEASPPVFACCAGQAPPWAAPAAPFGSWPPPRPGRGGEGVPAPPVVSTVPEAPAWIMMLTALVALFSRVGGVQGPNVSRRRPPLFGVLTASHDRPADRR